MSISIISAVKDRKEHLLSSYESWLKCNCVSEVVIVDWGSKEPVSEFLKESEKIKIVRVNPDHCRYWSFSQAYNIAARIASGLYIAVMNADEIILEPDVFCSIPIPLAENKMFYEGTLWGSEKAHGVYFLYLSRRLFWEVNGFNEKLVGYGYEDVDIRNRLQKYGAEGKSVSIEIEHIKHEATHESRENMLNYALAHAYPWDKKSRLIQLSLTGEKNLIRCDIDKSDQITQEEMLERKGQARALSGLLKINNLINGV